MRKALLTLVFTCIAYCSFAQWTTSGTNIYNSNTGNVGIGTTNPLTNLDVKLATNQHIQFVSGVNGAYPGASGIVCINDANTAYTPLGFYASNYYFGNGNVGIGTTTPGAVLDVSTLLSPGTLGTVLARLPEGNTTGAGTYLGIKGYNTQLSGNITNVSDVVSFSIEHSFYGITNSSINFLRGGGTSGGSISFNTNNNSEMMRLLYNGNLLIGKTSQTNAAYRLDVAGAVRANQIVVNTTGADFVFKPTYQLRSLSVLKKYINQNHHLPEIPSAKQMQTDGLNVGENQVKLLQKIEELTLYLIQQKDELEKQNKQQQEKISSQEERISKLEQSLERLLKNK